MAGNFWQSAHYKQWLLCKQDIIKERLTDFEVISEEEYQKVMIFFANFIQQLGKTLKLRQQVIATATVYVKRFYARNSLKCIDPLLLAPTAVFLASKVEESGVISNNRLISTCQAIVKNKFQHAYSIEFPYRIAQVFECEFHLLEAMDCCLVVYQPYRPLIQFGQDMACDQETLQVAWSHVNDSLRTDACLMFPPYEIALACLHMACVGRGKDCVQCFAELNTDIERVMAASQHLLAMYELKKRYDEKKEIAALLHKIPKPNCNPPR